MVEEDYKVVAKDRFGFGTTVLDKVREVSANQEAVAPEIEEPLAPSRKWWDSYNNYTKYEDQPHWSDRAPILQRNNPEYAWQFKEPSYWNVPKLWGNPPAEERFFSDSNINWTKPGLSRAEMLERQGREPEGYQEGGEINIKPSKVGSFTAW